MTALPKSPQDSTTLLNVLQKLHPKYIDLSLERMWRLLAALDNPQNKLPPVIHIAGTNGKGSTLAYLDAIGRVAGKKMHSYISPHLTDFHERITLAGKRITEAQLAALLAETEHKNNNHPITFFEAITAAALLGFSRQQADWLLLEVGMGGRLDATNVIAHPALCVLTPVSFDHENFLGSTLADIAKEKAGILKPGCMAISAAQPREAEQAIIKQAQKTESPLLIAKRDWNMHTKHNRLIIDHEDGQLDLPLPALVGAHQIENAALAALAAHYLGFHKNHIATGLQQAVWHGRLQKYDGDGLTRYTPARHIWLDGGHNPAAAQVLAKWLNDKADGHPLYMVCGMMQTKSPENWFHAFRHLPVQIHTTPIPQEENCHDSTTLAEAAEQAGLSARAFADPQAALSAIEDENALVLICGSLYLVGSMLSADC